MVSGENDIYYCSQLSGCRIHKFTMNALAQVACSMMKGFEEEKHTTAVFFDMEKACNSMESQNPR